MPSKNTDRMMNEAIARLGALETRQDATDQTIEEELKPKIGRFAPEADEVAVMKLPDGTEYRAAIVEEIHAGRGVVPVLQMEGGTNDVETLAEFHGHRFIRREAK